MADVFISYSRCDASFAGQLRDALTAHEVVAWLDVREVRPAEDWREAIRTEIDGANAVVFVLSPAWVQSLECAKELQRATEQHKRLIPMRHRELDTLLVPDALARLNWITAQEPDDFDGAVGKLLQALRTDLPWLKQHTSLCVRAVEWDEGGRHPSMTLSGRRLDQAETWLSTAPGKQQQPTDLQVQFLLASRKAVTRRVRIIGASVVFAAVVSTALGAYGYFQREEKARQLRIAAARQSLQQAEAVRDLPNAPWRLHESVAAAVHAVRGMRDSGVGTADADESLRRGLALLPGPPVEASTDAGSIQASGFDRGGRILVVVYSTGLVQVWDTVQFRVTSSWKIELPVMVRVKGIDVAAPSRRLAMLLYDGSAAEGQSIVTIRRLDDGRQVDEFKWAGYADRVRLSPNGMRVHLNAGLKWPGWMISSPAPTLPWPDERIGYALDFSPDGSAMALAYRERERRSYSIDIVDTSTGVRTVQWFESGRIRFLKWVPGSSRLLIGMEHAMLLRSEKSGALSASLAFRQGDPTAAAGHGVAVKEELLAINSEGTLVAEAARLGSVQVRDSRTGQEMRRLVGHGEVRNITFSPDGNAVITLVAGSSAMLQRWPIGPSSAWHELRHGEPLDSASFPTQPGMVMTASSAATRLWRLDPEGKPPADGGALDPKEAAALRPPGSDRRVALDGLASPQRVEVIDPASGTLAHFDTELFVTMAALSRDGRVLALLGYAGKVRAKGAVTMEIWDVDRRKRRVSATVGPQITGRARHDFDLSFLRLSPDGRIVATRDQGGFALWETGDLKRVAVLNHAGSEQLTWQHAGPHIATSGSDRRIRVWKVDDGITTEVARIPDDDALQDIGLSADAHWLIGRSAQGVARLFAVHAETLAKQACSRVRGACDAP